MPPSLSGTQLGPYQVLKLLGTGGMGDVYEARDTRLHRRVAIKLLREPDAHLRQSLEREARAIASLNHPHICTLYDVGHHDGLDFLVMEYLDGETLARRLRRGPLDLAQALQYAGQMAEALDAAHRTGVVHRDLKPGNVMLVPGGVKLLDFGIAKVRFDAQDAGGTTTTSPLTPHGTIIGTLNYMAPEQLEARQVDARADIWALGCVVYEMLAGERAFDGASTSSVIAAVLTSEPPQLPKLSARLPQPIVRVLRTCLAKDPDDRWQSARDLARQLNWLSDAPAVESDPRSAIAGRQAGPRFSRWARTAIGLLLLACAAGASAVLLRPRPDQAVRRLSVVLPPAIVIYPNGGPFVSPDGRRLLVVGEEADKSRLWLRDLERDAFEPLQGTEGATFPFWAPGGDRIGFFADRKLKKVALDGGVVETIADVGNARGGAWGADGTILFTVSTNAGLSRVSAAGGGPSPVTQKAPDELSHRFPVFLPDGRHFLFTVTKALGRSDIAFASLDNPTPIQLVTDASDPAHTRDGRLWFARNRAVFAQAFDSVSHTVRGAPVTVVTDIGYNAVNHHADYSVANDGTLAYATDAGREELTWIDRATGRLEHVANEEPIGFNWTVSPDGERLAYSAWTPDSHQGGLMVWDMRRGVKTRMLPDVNVLERCIAWSSAGDRLAVTGQRKTEYEVLALSLSGAPDTQTLVRQPEYACVQTWTPDGRYVLVSSGRPSSVTAVAAVPGSPPLTLAPAVPPGAVSAAISPDGRWIAYIQLEGSRLEGYIQRFPPDGRASKFTPDEVSNPVWGGDGAEIFYTDSMSSIKSVRVIASAKGELSASGPSLVARRAGAATGIIPFFVSPDGQRILTLAQSADVRSRRTLSLILNWPALLSDKR
jgi:Tol biopolymer transport system component/predicted Ser/Thr protein kinase